MSKKIYRTTATALNGRDGKVSLSDHQLIFDMQPNSNGLNPEQLLAVAYSSCYGESVKEVINHNKLNANIVKMDCRVILIKENIGYRFEINFMAYLSNTDDTEAKKLLKEAHKLSPFSVSFGDNITIKTEYTLV